MVTDPARIRRTDKGDPDKCPVGDLHKFFDAGDAGQGYDGCRSAGIGCIECKGWAADALVKVPARSASPFRSARQLHRSRRLKKY
jgi:tryptophanyl-tRNA synthetase